MNRLSTEKRAQIVGALVEGNSIRATVRMSGAAKNTVTKLLVDLGWACAEYQDRVLRELPCTTIECDEVWSFCYAKAKNVPQEHRGTFGYGDVWTWTALCADTKLVPSWLVGERTVDDAWTFMADDLKSRLTNRVQLSTDGHRSYLQAVPYTFGEDVDYAMIQKEYGPADADTHQERKYSPNVCTGIEIRTISGNPDPERISTSYVERPRGSPITSGRCARSRASLIQTNPLPTCLDRGWSQRTRHRRDPRARDLVGTSASNSSRSIAIGSKALDREGQPSKAETRTSLEVSAGAAPAALPEQASADRSPGRRHGPRGSSGDDETRLAGP